RGTFRSALGMLAAPSVVYEDGDWRPASLRVPRARFAFPQPVGAQPVMPYPSGELLTVPRHVRTRAMRSLITVETFTGTPKAAPLAPLVVPGMALALRSPLRRALEPLLARFPEGPSEASRARVQFTIVAEAHGEDGRSRRGVATGGDVYALTAVTAVHGAALMAQAGYDRAGFLAPAEAYDAAGFLAALAEHGVAYTVD
ncbi:MAG TPA: hypothetical protein VFS37_15370, partial [Conexibacter sp.]|nr:hypothetical protein [Conexibacter sp.]